MKASDLKPGDVIRRCPSEPGPEGWTVAKVEHGATDECGNDERVLLELEREEPCGKVVGTGEPVMVLNFRTAWLPVDAEVYVDA